MKFLIEDIDLEPYSDFEINSILKFPDPFMLNIVSNEQTKWEIKIDKSMKIEDIKRLILNKARKPFWILEQC